MINILNNDNTVEATVHCLYMDAKKAEKVKAILSFRLEFWETNGKSLNTKQ